MNKYTKQGERIENEIGYACMYKHLGIVSPQEIERKNVVKYHRFENHNQHERW